MKLLLGIIALSLFVGLTVYDYRQNLLASEQRKVLLELTHRLNPQGRERYMTGRALDRFTLVTSQEEVADSENVAKYLETFKSNILFSTFPIYVEREAEWLQSWPDLQGFINSQEALRSLKDKYLETKFTDMEWQSQVNFAQKWLVEFIAKVDQVQELDADLVRYISNERDKANARNFRINLLGFLSVISLGVAIIILHYREREVLVEGVSRELNKRNKKLELSQLILQSQSEDIKAEKYRQERLLEKLTDTELRARTINQLLPVGLILVNDRGFITEVNKEATHLFHYSENDLIGMKVDKLVPSAKRVGHANLRQSFKAESQQRIMAANDKTLSGERSDGSLIPLEIGLAPLVLGGKKHTLATLVDVEERRRVLEELQEKNHQMDEALDKLRQSNEQLERFAFICSHDLQEPVRMVQSFSQLLEKRAASKLDEKDLGYLKHVTEGADRARQMISDILEFCRVDKNIEKYSSVSLDELCDQVKRTLQVTLEERGARFDWQQNLPVISGVQSQLFQLIMNMVSNGIKFNHSDEPHVHLSAQESGENYEIIVKDNGIGIKQEYIHKLFQIFTRLNSRSEFPGTGIGLAISKKIVESHGGNIRIESEHNKGTEFIIIWPKEISEKHIEIIGTEESRL